MKRETKAERRHKLHTRLQALGFTFEECQALRRIEMTLHRWAELECGTDAGHIERDEKTGKPRFFSARARYIQANDPRAWITIPDREKGALRRLESLIELKNFNEYGDKMRFNQIIYYHQTDPRGCALYVGRKADLGGLPIDQAYNRLVAVCD